MKFFILLFFGCLGLSQVHGENIACVDYSILNCKDCKENHHQFLLEFAEIHKYILTKKDQLLQSLFKITTVPGDFLSKIEKINENISFLSPSVINQFGNLTKFEPNDQNRDEYCSEMIRNFQKYMVVFHKEIAVYDVIPEENLLKTPIIQEVEDVKETTVVKEAEKVVPITEEKPLPSAIKTDEIKPEVVTVLPKVVEEMKNLPTPIIEENKGLNLVKDEEKIVAKVEKAPIKVEEVKIQTAPENKVEVKPEVTDVKPEHQEVKPKLADVKSEIQEVKPELTDVKSEVQEVKREVPEEKKVESQKIPTPVETVIP